MRLMVGQRVVGLPSVKTEISIAYYVSQFPLPSIICRFLFEPEGTLSDPE